ncbi:MAG TPA: hypothetical protein VK934_11585 [Fimbriimonas sp.]|nr:hypothetical protein [Fimbriimonas sp.]
MESKYVYAISALLGVGLASNSPAFDYNGTPAAWAVGLSETTAIINQRIDEGWRPTSIDATSPGSTLTKFGTCYVGNSASHQKTVMLATNVSSTTINSYRSNGWRIEDVERTGSTSYSALFTRSVENPVPTGWFVNLTTEQVTSLLGSTRRILELDSVVISGVRKFNGVWVDNSGANAKGWGWMPGHTIKQITDWARDNAMRIIDLDPRGGDLYAAVFVKRKAGERVLVGVGTWSAISELQESSGTRIQVLNRLEGQNHYAAVLVSNANSQTIRVADALLSTAGGGRIGAYVREVNGATLVDLRSTREFYPCSSTKVMIHAAGLAAVPVDQLDTYKVGGYYLSYGASKMMKNSDNAWTYTLNSHFGTSYINQYCRDYLGTTTKTWIADHYGNTPPDNNWNSTATLRDLTSIYAKRGVLGAARVAKFREWMNTETSTTLFDSTSQALATSLGLTNAQYSLWKSRVRYEFKAGNVGLNGSSTTNLHWVNAGRITLPYGNGTYYPVKTYVFGHFVNDSVTGYASSVTKGHSTGLVREQLIESLSAFR